MEDFKFNVEQGGIKLTPTEWLKELASLILKEGFLKGDNEYQVLNQIDVFEALKDGYEEAASPLEYFEEAYYE